jgi:hypothetical protein
LCKLEKHSIMSSPELPSSQQQQEEEAHHATNPENPSAPTDNTPPSKRQKLSTPDLEPNPNSTTTEASAVQENPTSESAPSTTTATAATTTTPPPPNPRLAALHRTHATLSTKLAALEAQRAAHIAATQLPPDMAADDPDEQQRARHALAAATAVIRRHIALLHDYNEIKDVGQGLMGMIAERRGVRVGVVMEEFGVGEKD